MKFSDTLTPSVAELFNSHREAIERRVPFGVWTTLSGLVSCSSKEQVAGLVSRFAAAVRPGVDYRIVPYRLRAWALQHLRQWHLSGTGAAESMHLFDETVAALATQNLDTLQRMRWKKRVPYDCLCGERTYEAFLQSYRPDEYHDSGCWRDCLCRLAWMEASYTGHSQSDYMAALADELFRLMEAACNERPLFAVEFPSGV